MVRTPAPSPLACFIFDKDSLRENELVSTELGIKYFIHPPEDPNRNHNHIRMYRQAGWHFTPDLVAGFETILAKWKWNDRDRVRLHIPVGNPPLSKDDFVDVEGVLKRDGRWSSSRSFETSEPPQRYSWRREKNDLKLYRKDGNDSIVARSVQGDWKKDQKTRIELYESCDQTLLDLIIVTFWIAEKQRRDRKFGSSSEGAFAIAGVFGSIWS